MFSTTKHISLNRIMTNSFTALLFFTHTCINPSGQPGSSAPEGDSIRLASVVSKSLSAIPSSNRPTVKPSKMICGVTNVV